LSVLAPDLHGFGESEDPSLPLEEDFRFEEAVVRVARQALEEGWASNGEFVYMGYSLGAGVVLRAARREPQPAAVITVGAPATGELLTQRGEQWLQQFALRRLEDMQLVPDEKSRAVIERYVLDMDVIKQVRMEDLPPTLLIYGELENPPPIQRPNFTKGAGITHVALIPGAPHSYNTLRVIGPIIVYNRVIADSVVSAAKQWANRSTR
jgi:dienelactone hydrolase